MSGTLELTIPAKSSAIEAPTDVDALDTAKPLAEIFRKAKAEADRLAEIARKEREELAAKAKAEADKAAKEQAKLRAELEAKAKAEAAEKARIAKEEAAKAEAARKAAAAPDKAKLESFAAAVRALAVPALNNHTVLFQVREQVEEFAIWIESRIKEL